MRYKTIVPGSFLEKVFEIEPFTTDEGAEVVEKQGKTDRDAVLTTENDFGIVLNE